MLCIGFKVEPMHFSQF